MVITRLIEYEIIATTCQWIAFVPSAGIAVIAIIFAPYTDSCLAGIVSSTGIPVVTSFPVRLLCKGTIAIGVVAFNDKAGTGRFGACALVGRHAYSRLVADLAGCARVAVFTGLSVKDLMAASCE